METPTLKIDDKFSVVLITEDNYEEAYNCFIDGFVASHPFFVALKATREEVDQFYKQKYRYAFESRPLQQYAAIDTQNNNKIVAIFLTQEFTQLADKQAIIDRANYEKSKQNEISRMRYEYDNKIFEPEILKPYVEEINRTGNTMLYQQTGISVLPEYYKFGLFFKLLYVAFYISAKLGVVAWIDLIYNKVTGYMSVKHCGGKVLNEVNIKDDLYKGEKVFDNEMTRAQVTYTPLTAPKTVEAINNDEFYGQFYKDCVQYVNFIKAQKNIESMNLEDAQN